MNPRPPGLQSDGASNRATEAGNINNIQVNNLLSDNKKDELKLVLQSSSDVLSDVPGKTSVIEHDVMVKTESPVTKIAYMLPYALREKVRKEIDDMLEVGIAEKSTSPYASPIVIVPKKDGGVRLCVDYIQLNEITISDPQPMSKFEDIINKLGKAKYLSKLDLTKGFGKYHFLHRLKQKVLLSPHLAIFISL